MKPAAYLALALVHSISEAAPFRNGGFELEIIPSVEDYIYGGSSQITGWMIIGDNFLTRLKGNARVEGPDPAEGQQQLSFNSGGSPSGMAVAQEFDTTKGEHYEVAFSIGRRGTGSGLAAVKAEVSDSDGTLLTSLFWGTTENEYNRQILYFTAKSSSSILKFTDETWDIQQIDMLLDAVAVRPYPAILNIEPAVLLSFPSDSDRWYSLQATDSLTRPEWKIVGRVHGTGTISELLLPTRNGQFRYFRLRPINPSDQGTNSYQVDVDGLQYVGD